MLLEIKCDATLSADQRKILKHFNDKYDNWAYSSENEETFTECQHKLMSLLHFVLDTLRNSKGLVDMCKIEPPIQLRSYETEATRLEYQILTLREMLLNCVHRPYDVFEMEDFEQAGASNDVILERNKDIDEIKSRIIEYEDTSHFYEDEDYESDDEDDEDDENDEEIMQEAQRIIMTSST